MTPRVNDRRPVATPSGLASLAVLVLIEGKLVGQVVVALDDFVARSRVNGTAADGVAGLRDQLLAVRNGHEVPTLVWPAPAADADPDPLLTTSQVAKHLHLSERSVRRLLASGDLPSTRPSPRRVCVRASAVQAYLEQR